MTEEKVTSRMKPFNSMGFSNNKETPLTFARTLPDSCKNFKCFSCFISLQSCHLVAVWLKWISLLLEDVHGIAFATRVFRVSSLHEESCLYIYFNLNRPKCASWIQFFGREFPQMYLRCSRDSDGLNPCVVLPYAVLNVDIHFISMMYMYFTCGKVCQ